jgi:septal ring factor EnvC (AmiA/AmiB activator)
MSKPNTRRLDKEIRLTERKLEAVRNEEMWPLTSSERRQVMSALVGGSYRTLRSKSTSRAERKLETTWQSVQTRLIAELTALQTERQRIVNEAATAKAAKKSSGWW